MSVKITRTNWGHTPAGENIFLFTLTNASGAYVQLTNYGATVVAICVPDKHGHLGNTILGFDTAQGYLEDVCYIGSTIGRVANRISHARFNLNNKEYQLTVNNGRNCNHGGEAGFNQRIFGFEIKDDKLIMVLHSHDGDGGFPGNLTLRVTYQWTDDNTLKTEYQAAAEEDTIANFTNHAYFNLSANEPHIGNHRLTISSKTIAQSTADDIPTGNIIAAGNKYFDDHLLSQKINVNAPQGQGINSFYILDNELAAQKGYAAKLSHPESGRTMEVHTSYPGIFLYTGDYLSSTQPNSRGHQCLPFEALCLECQLYPDAINRPEFPPITLPAHKLYHHYIHLKFTTECD